MKAPRSILFRETDGLTASDERPLSARVENRLRQAILDGNLGPGTRLPSSRMLARDLHVSRYTVEWAFDRLASQGFVDRRRGSGTFVATQLPERDLPPSLDRNGSTGNGGTAVTSEKPAFSRRGAAFTAPLFAWRPTPGTAFTPSLPAPDLFPRQVWARLLTRAVRRSGLESWIYGPSGGLPELREAIAAHIGGTRAVACSPEQVIVLSSAHQAVDLAVRVLTNEGDPVWMEDPCYPPIVRLFASAAVRAVPVPVDTNGFNVQAALTAEPGGRLAYVTPSHQYPSGVTMSLERRHALLEWARTEKGWIIEDDYDGDLHFAGRPLAPLQRLDHSGRVIYVGTFSKMMFPSLRLAFLIAPPALVDGFRRAKHSMDGHAPGHTQVALADFIHEGHLATHLRRVVAEYDRRRRALLDGLAAISELVQPGPSNSGLQFSVYFRQPMDDRAVVDFCRREDVEVLALSPFYRGPSRPGLVMGFACSHPGRTRAAMPILLRAIQQAGG